jgi:hypothetical protein
MSRGKYSPICPHARDDNYKYEFNCYGNTPEPWAGRDNEPGRTFDTKTMIGYYDSEGYDSYGYSSFDSDGNYVGNQAGIDRAGYTENDYLTLQDLDTHGRATYYD